MIFDIYGKCNKFFRIVFIFFAFAVCSLIFYMSAQTASVSSKTSGELIFKFSKLFVQQFEELDASSKVAFVEAMQFIVRKSAHFLIYAFLGFNVAGAFSTFKIQFNGLFISSLVFSLVYAISDEVHQLFVKGRSCEVRDVLIDLFGALAGICLFLLIATLILKKKYTDSNSVREKNMRKKKLILQNKLLEEKLNQANSVINSLNDEISILKDKINVLSVKSEVLENLADNEEKESSTVMSCEDIVTDSANETVPVNALDFNTKIVDIVPDCGVENEDYAVSCVAKVILECTKAELCVSSSNSTSAVDDKNVILGEAESTKMRLYEILNNNNGNADIKQQLDTEVNSYVEKVKNILIKY